MEFTTYGMQQLALGNDAKFRAIVALAMDIVASVQDWNETGKKVSRAECEAKLAMALTLAKVAETSARRFLSTVSGLVTQCGKEYRETLASIKAAMVQANEPMGAETAVGMLCATLAAEGVENLSFLEAFARKGKPGLAAIKAETQAKIDVAEAKAAMTAEEAAEAATAEAAEKAADTSPRAKAAKQAAAILASIAKHGPMMELTELQAIAAAIGEQIKAQVSVAEDKRAADIAAELTKRAA